MCYIKWRKPNAVAFAIGLICITFLLGIIVMSENKNRRDKAERDKAEAEAKAEAEDIAEAWKTYPAYFSL